MNIGILSLQGDFCKHASMLDVLNVKNFYVRSKSDLLKCDGLIIPGGESTTITKLIYKYSLDKILKDFSKTNSIFGTCAGAIIMSKNCFDSNVFNIGCIDANILRNAWGSQIHSFVDDIEFNLESNYEDLGKINKKVNVKGFFIRAPKIERYKNSFVIGICKKEAVIVRNKKHLMSTFHPELTLDTTIHEYFIKMVNE